MTNEEVRQDAEESLVRTTKMSFRAIQIVAACLAISMLVLVFSIASVIGVASSAQKDADRAALENERLSTELQCRSRIATRFAVADGNLAALIAEGLILVSRGDDLGELTPRLAEAVEVLNEASAERLTAVKDCSQD